MVKYKDNLEIKSLLSIQPFVEPEKLEIKDTTLLSNLNKNDLYKIYQKTKDQGWFLGYITSERNNQFQIFPTPLRIFGFSAYKAKVYWKDLITPIISKAAIKIRYYKNVK